MNEPINMYLKLPNSNVCICPGNRVRLGRFHSVPWVVKFGWYTWGGNRPVCGWYLLQEESDNIKPLQLPDLDDRYLVE